ncbi:MAG: Lrp/AsnC family transcriptional regulator [Xanthomonadales bacterium]|nr:Lrp/AsnC family transcriptional regulator [Xanthomonadales bacterium]
MTIDRTDFEIIRELRRNARISNKDLAEKVGLAASSCLVRLRRLHREGVIRGYHAEVDPAPLGIQLQALTSVRLNRHARPQVESFLEHILKRREVIRVYHLSGRDDFLVQICVASAQHLREFVLEAFTERAEVDHVETSLIYESWDSWDLPEFSGEGSQD